MPSPAYTYTGGASSPVVFTAPIHNQSFSAFWRVSAPIQDGTEVLNLGAGGLRVVARDGYYILRSNNPGIVDNRSMLAIPQAAHTAGIVSNGAHGVTFYVDDNAYVFGDNLFATQFAVTANNSHAGVDSMTVYSDVLSTCNYSQAYAPMVFRKSFVNIVFDGNSLVADSSRLSFATIALASVAKRFTSSNVAIGGQTTDQMLTRQSSVVYPKFSPFADANVLVVMEGTNQLGVNGYEPVDAYSKMKTYCENARVRGWRVVVGTVLPQDAFGGATFEAARQALNASIRAGYTTFADALFDSGADAVIGQPGQWSNSAYYLPDKIHLNPAGNAIVAGLVVSALGGLI